MRRRMNKASWLEDQAPEHSEMDAPVELSKGEGLIYAVLKTPPRQPIWHVSFEYIGEDEELEDQSQVLALRKLTR